jgi:rhamnose transport system substrate-binding protein
MFTKHRTRRLGVAFTAMAAAAALALTGCAGGNGDGGDAGGEGGGDANLSVTFLPKNLGNPYFDTSSSGGQEAVEEFGGEFAEVGPSEASPTSQVSFIQTAAQQGVGALVVSANDPEAICDALDEARDAGAATCSSTRPPPRASPRSRST